MQVARNRDRHTRHRIPLVARSRVQHTFFGLGLFAVITLFLCGAYLLTQAIRDPKEASDGAVIVAGFTLSLASFVFTYLVWPWAKFALIKDQDSRLHREKLREAVLTVYAQAPHTRVAANQTLAGNKNLHRRPM
jgi:hypothetical protein